MSKEETMYDVYVYYTMGGRELEEKLEILTLEETIARVRGTLADGIRTVWGYVRPETVQAVVVMPEGSTMTEWQEWVEQLPEGEAEEEDEEERLKRLDREFWWNGVEWVVKNFVEEAEFEGGPPAEVVPREEEQRPDPDLEAELELEALVGLLGIGEEIGMALWNDGIRTVEDVAAASDEALLGIPGIGKKTLEKIRAQVG